MVTKANLELMANTDGISWITALKAPQIKKLARDQTLQLSLFDQTNLAEISAGDYPGERLIVCRNPLVAAERSRKREDLLAATEQELEAIAARVKGGTLAGSDKIGLAVGPALKHYKVGKHFQVTITDDSFTFERKSTQIDAEAALDGIYILRTNLPESEMAAGDVVGSYKGLEQVELAFRTLKGPELEIRPIHHHLETRVRAHVFLCMLAYYLTWHLQHAWAPLIFKDEYPTAQADPVAKAARSPQALKKAAKKKTANGEPVHSYKTLLAELATQTENTIRLPGAKATFNKLTTPTPLQAHAIDLIQTANLDL